MRMISLLLTLLVLGYLATTYLGTEKSAGNQAGSRPKEIIDNAEKQVNQAVDDYQKMLKKRAE